MPGPGDRVTAVEIQVALAVAGEKPDTLAALRDDGHLFVRRQLKLLFERGDLV